MKAIPLCSPVSYLISSVLCFSPFQIAFWLLENGLRVIIAACDTFRSGAVEQLRTHARRLNHHYPAEREGGPERLLLYERGYGKDAAGIAMEAIHCGEG